MEEIAKIMMKKETLKQVKIKSKVNKNVLFYYLNINILGDYQLLYEITNLLGGFNNTYARTSLSVKDTLPSMKFSGSILQWVSCASEGAQA